MTTEAALAQQLATALSSIPSASGPPNPDSIVALPSLQAAIDATRPELANVVGRLDTGSALLALWASQHLDFSSLQALPETTPALFRKDPEGETGKRLCMLGTILEIRAEKTLAGRLLEDRAPPLIDKPAALPNAAEPARSAAPADSSSPPTDLPRADDWAIRGGGKVFFATISQLIPEDKASDHHTAYPTTPAKAPVVVELIAVRSTGALVEGNEARACGVLTGVTLPTVRTEGSGPEAPRYRIVGMLDLPENH